MENGQRILRRAVLTFLVRDDEVLLAMGADGKRIGAGFWNGYGGEIEQGETLRQAAVREIKEESLGLIVLPEQLEKSAIVYFRNRQNDGNKFICRIHVYLVSQWFGEPQESGEMLNPTWFNRNCLPDKMMPADPYWLPYVLDGKKIVAAAKLGPFQEFLIGEVRIKQVSGFSGD